MSGNDPARPFLVEPGSVFGFRTSPAYPDSPPETHRFGALLVLAHNRHVVAVGSLAGVWPMMPTLADVEGKPLLRRNRFSFPNLPAVYGCGPDDIPHGLQELTRLGRRVLDEEQQDFADRYMGDKVVGRSFTWSGAADYDVEAEWRWANDQAAFLRESELDQQRQAGQRQAAAERYETRLKDLTWDTLLSEQTFARWDESPPFPPAAFRDAATRQVHATCRQLQGLGRKPRKAEVRAALRSLVQWFNEADERAGWVIETEEREDIDAVLQEIAHVARHPTVHEETPPWRTW